MTTDYDITISQSEYASLIDDRDAAEQKYTDLRDAVLAWCHEWEDATWMATDLRNIVARVERGES